MKYNCNDDDDANDDDDDNYDDDDMNATLQI